MSATQFALYVGLITSNIIVQSITNAIMISVGNELRSRCFKFKSAIIMTILLYITIIGLTIDVFIWTVAVYWLGLFETFSECFAFALDAFSTLGGRNPLRKPWESLAPIIAFTGILIISFAAATMFSVIYPGA